ncbi:MAG: hypothetical protein JW787_09935 [Sedimentisphaerales bacterium]|nr:hypothetical protein [Sedimentisphaerales bacterium]
MFKKVMSLRFLIILTMIAAVAGCDNKKGEIQELKTQLAKTQKELDYWQGRYDALCADYKGVKADRRSLGDVSKTAEEQLYAYAKEIIRLQAENQELNAFVAEQEAIIADQEAALQQFIDSVDQTSVEQAVSY